MLNQRTASVELGGEVPDQNQIPDVLLSLLSRLQERGLGNLALILTELMKVWGFVGSQVLWMLSPFLADSTIMSVAAVLESPETLDQVQIHLMRDPAGCALTRDSGGEC